MIILWWIFLISILFYPTFMIMVFYTDRHPNSKITKWWEKYIVEKEKENYD